MAVDKAKHVGCLLPIFIILTLFVISPAAADIYLYIDSEGVLHFTNTPTPQKHAINH